VANAVGELVFLSGPYRGRRIPIARELTRIGRDKTCEVPLDDEASSRRHAELIVREGKIFIKDLGSTNGSYLNDSKLGEEIELHSGDRIGIGDTVMLVELRATQLRINQQVTFSEERDSHTTRLTLPLDDTRLLKLQEGTSANDAHRHFTLLYEFMSEVSGVLHRAALLERVLGFFLTVFRADRGVIMLLTPEGKPGEKVVRAKENIKGDEGISIPRTLAQLMLQKKESFISEDTGTDDRLARSESIASLGAHSALGVPLKLKDRVLGLVYMDRVVSKEPFTEGDLRLCSAMALQAAVCLENANLYSELLDAAEFGNALLKSLASGLMVTDLEGQILRVNRAALEILKCDESSLINRQISKMPELEALNRVVEATIRSGKAEDRYEIRLHAGTETIPIGLNTSMLTDHSGKPIGVVANFRNLTPIRHLEEQLRRSQHMAALGQMAAGVAHEVRNPLNSIRGFTQLIKESASEKNHERIIEFVQIVTEEVDRVNRIVQDLLEFSRQRELTLTPMYMEKLLPKIAREMELEFKKAEIQLTLDLPEAPLPGVLGNEDKLHQVFLNVLLNAIQASKAGQKVTVKAALVDSKILKEEGPGRREELTRREISVTIADQGSGINPDALPKIFDPFFTQKDIGTGLGLSISQKIVDQHGGRIEVQSKPNEGAAFTIYLPAI